jgi:hypothetical protein
MGEESEQQEESCKKSTPGAPAIALRLVGCLDVHVLAGTLLDEG